MLCCVYQKGRKRRHARTSKLENTRRWLKYQLFLCCRRRSRFVLSEHTLSKAWNSFKAFGYSIQQMKVLYNLNDNRIMILGCKNHRVAFQCYNELQCTENCTDGLQNYIRLNFEFWWVPPRHFRVFCLKLHLFLMSYNFFLKINVLIYDGKRIIKFGPHSFEGPSTSLPSLHLHS